MMEFNSTLLENHTNSQKVYMCGDYNVDLLKLSSTPFNENYFDNILSAGYIPKITLTLPLLLPKITQKLPNYPKLPFQLDCQKIVH